MARFEVRVDITLQADDEDDARTQVLTALENFPGDTYVQHVDAVSDEEEA